MKVTFKVTITEDYKLKCSIVVDSKKEETTIKIQDKEEYSLQFTLDGNHIDFMNDLINKPDEYKLYSIHCFKKEYSVVAEVLFSLILDKIVRKVKKEYIIEKTIIELPSTNKMFKERINVALDAIGMKGIEIGEEITFDYSEQAIILNEILEKKEVIEKRRKIVEKANEYAKQMEIEEIEMNETQLETIEKFEKEITKKFTFEQRKAMNLCSLDNYCIFIASRYLESLDDHINLTFVSKRMRGNMEKFHYNPISVDSISVKWFPNVETLHLYNENDEYLNGGRIQKYVNWNKLSYHQFKELKENKENEYKRIIWTLDDTKKEYEKQNPNDDWNFDFKLSIPEGVNEIDEDCFDDSKLHELIIPTTVKIIPKKCIENCWRLTNITISLNENQIIIGNKIFNTPHLDQVIYLTDRIKIINGNEVDGSKMEIPTIVTSIDEECFHGCEELKQVIIPETVKFIPFDALFKLHMLEELTTVSNEYKLIGDRIFYVVDNCIYSVILPSTIKKVNGKEIELKQLETFTIPTSVTKLSEYCFANCKKLTEIKGLENVKEYGKGCFFNCQKLYESENPLFDYYKTKTEYKMLSKFQKDQLEEWTELKCSEILFDSNLDDWKIDTSVFNERIIGKSKLIFIIEDDYGEKFGYYLNTEVIEKYDDNQQTDWKTFHFNLQSNGRLPKPSNFKIKNLNEGGIHLYQISSDYLIKIGKIFIMKENYKNYSYYDQIDHFDFQRIAKALCGRTYPERFTPYRVLVIQMK